MHQKIPPPVMEHWRRASKAVLKMEENRLVSGISSIEFCRGIVIMITSLKFSRRDEPTLKVVPVASSSGLGG